MLDSKARVERAARGQGGENGRGRSRARRGSRKGTNGVGTSMGSLRILCLLTEGTFWGAPVNLLLSSQKCQGVPFSPIRQNSLHSQPGPVVFTPLVRNQDAPRSNIM